MPALTLHACKLRLHAWPIWQPRLREAAKREGPSGRQRSGSGARGAGQSRSQLDRQKVRERITELQKEIDIMESSRDTQRSRRQGLAQVALVGYTNAGNEIPIVELVETYFMKR